MADYPLTVETPIRPPSVGADVRQPLISAAISGALIGGLFAGAVCGIALLAGADPAAWLPVGGFCGAFLALAVTTYDWFTQRAAAATTIWSVEKRTGADLDGDGQIGRPHGMTTNVPAQPDPAAAMQEKTAAMLAAIWATNSTTFSSIRGRTGLDRDDYNEIRDQLIRAGIAAWIGGGRSHGWQPAPGLDLSTAQRTAEKKIVWLPAPTPRPVNASKSGK